MVPVTLHYIQIIGGDNKTWVIRIIWCFWCIARRSGSWEMLILTTWLLTNMTMASHRCEGDPARNFEIFGVKHKSCVILSSQLQCQVYFSILDYVIQYMISGLYLVEYLGQKMTIDKATTVSPLYGTKVYCTVCKTELPPHCDKFILPVSCTRPGYTVVHNTQGR